MFPQDRATSRTSTWHGSPCQPKKCIILSSNQHFSSFRDRNFGYQPTCFAQIFTPQSRHLLLCTSPAAACCITLHCTVYRELLQVFLVAATSWQIQRDYIVVDHIGRDERDRVMCPELFWSSHMCSEEY